MGSDLHSTFNRCLFCKVHKLIIGQGNPIFQSVDLKTQNNNQDFVTQPKEWAGKIVNYRIYVRSISK
jgi:hypothetical protein